MGAYDAVIEIPRGSRVKYEVDHGTGRVFLDRILYTAFGYPTNYGFFENTLGEDGDPLDVLVLLDFDLAPGVLASVRPVGVLKMSDEAGGDDKVVAVLAQGPALGAHPGRRRHPRVHAARRSSTSSSTTRTSSPNKWVKVDEWADAAEAERLVAEAFDRFKEHEGQTATQGEGVAPKTV